MKVPTHRAQLLLASAREKLYRAPAKRPTPIRDEKILTAWNGLMISALARAGLVLDESDYTQTAKIAAEFLLENLYEDGHLRRSFKDGSARHNGYLDDYAFFTAALLDFYEASGEFTLLQQTLALDESLEKLYEDGERGSFFMTSGDHEELLARRNPRLMAPNPRAIPWPSSTRCACTNSPPKTASGSVQKRGLKAFAGGLQTNPMALSEIIPLYQDSFRHYHLGRIRENYPLSVQGVSLSLGGAAPPDSVHLRRCARCWIATSHNPFPNTWPGSAAAIPLSMICRPRPTPRRPLARLC